MGDVRKVVVIRATDPHPALNIVQGDGVAHALIWPGMGARCRTLHHIFLGPRAQTVDLCHEGEAVYYVLSGSPVVVDLASFNGVTARAGTVVHIDGATLYRIKAGPAEVQLVGGPCPPDPLLYKEVEL